MLRIGGERAQGLRRRLEQHVVQQRLVLVGDGLDGLRHGEHDVRVFDRQQLGINLRGPFVRDKLFYAVSYEYSNTDNFIDVTTPATSANWTQTDT